MSWIATTLGSKNYEVAMQDSSYRMYVQPLTTSEKQHYFNVRKNQTFVLITWFLLVVMWAYPPADQITDTGGFLLPVLLIVVPCFLYVLTIFLIVRNGRKTIHSGIISNTEYFPNSEEDSKHHKITIGGRVFRIDNTSPHEWNSGQPISILEFGFEQLKVLPSLWKDVDHTPKRTAAKRIWKFGLCDLITIIVCLIWLKIALSLN